MKNYIVFNGDGEILRTGICPDDMFRMQAQPGESVIEGACNDINDRIVEGKVVRKTEEEISLIRKKLEIDPKEWLISQKMNEILRKQAIKELIKEGKMG